MLSSTDLSSFARLGVPAGLVEVLTELGIQTPTPIQAATLPDSLAGRDVLGRGRTGSGKTYAFLLPLVARLAGGRARPKAPRALVLAPTRELVAQIEASLAPLARAAGLTYCTVFGGVGQTPQVAALKRGVDIVLACPGRLEDLIGQRACTLSAVEVCVLDEADHMADLGFLPGVRRILSQTPERGQRLLFSATLDNAIDVLVRQFLHQPVTHQADSAQSPVAAMSHHLLQIEREHRLDIIADLGSAPGRTVVFTRTKHGAKAMARQLTRRGVPAVDLHGNLSQNARTRNLDAFHTGQVSVLVATDIAARGIHVDDVALVLHADPPTEHKAYLHRSGRTARAGAEGTVVTLMTNDQVREVQSLTRAAGIKAAVTRISGSAHPVLAELAPGPRVLAEPVESPVESRSGGRASGGGAGTKGAGTRGAGTRGAGTRGAGTRGAGTSAPRAAGSEASGGGRRNARSTEGDRPAERARGRAAGRGEATKPKDGAARPPREGAQVAAGGASESRRPRRRRGGRRSEGAVRDTGQPRSSGRPAGSSPTAPGTAPRRGHSAAAFSAGRN